MNLSKIATLVSFSIALTPVVLADDLNEIEVPAITNSAWQPKPASFYQSPYEVSLFDAKNGENKDRLWSQTKSVMAYGFGVIGVIWMMPEDISNWDKEGEFFKKWGDNVTGGPVWDRDVAWINLIGHPYFGGVYYQVARKSGYRQWDSFVYSALMSTFYWEYGIEAFAEVPSIQDLVLTPVVGWAYGEYAYQKEREIRARGSKVFGSETWGSITLFFLDPVDSLGRGLNNLFNRKVVEAGTGSFGFREIPLSNGKTDDQVYLSVSYPIGNGGPINRADYQPNYTQITNDPIDTSMISFSVGFGHTQLDSDWGVDDDFVSESSVGLHFGRKYSFHLGYSRGHMQDNVLQEDLTYENYSVNGKMYFRTEENLRPTLLQALVRKCEIKTGIEKHLLPMLV